MKAFAVDLSALQTVAAAVLDTDGVLLQANAGFLRLLPADCTQPIGARAARFFIQPSFKTLAAAPAMPAGAGQESYRGLMTIGDYAGKTRTLRGQAWRSAIGVKVLAEYDIAELEKLNDTMLDLNRQSAVAQHALTGANIVLTQEKEQLTVNSLTDALTGLGNRRKLDQALATEISRVQRGGGTLSAIMADIDHFKSVNDEYGHSAGDKVLAGFGAILRSQTRPTDIPVRFGGEEFLVLMPHTTLAQAAEKAELLRAAIAAEIIAPLERLLTSSFGAAELRAGEDGESFLGRVDKALYQAKAGGRNRVVTASTEDTPGRTR